MTNTRIVILGGGVAGLSAALNLRKKFRDIKEVSIVLIDRESYHLFTPNLYEVATAAEELVTLKNLKQSIALPFTSILNSRRIEFVKGEVVEVDALQKTVALAGRKVPYDYLVLALGSCEEYFNIPGAKDYGLPLKSLPHALKIKNSVEFAIESRKYEVQKPYVKIVVAGGGYTGVELAGELKGLIDFLAWKHQFPREKILVEIVEASNMLMPGMGQRATRDAFRRLEELKISLRLLSPIVKVDARFIELLSGERIAYDVLIWTAGIRSKPLPKGINAETDKKGRAIVDEFLRIKGAHNIFVVGDQAGVCDPGGAAVPQSAQDALSQSAYVAYALPEIIRNRRPHTYKPKKHGFIVSLGGRWAILNIPPFYITGYFAYLIHMLADVRYFSSLIGFFPALKLVWSQASLYSRND